MAWFLCTVSQREPDNWEKAKEVGLWGVPGVSYLAKVVKKGDQMLFWRAARGYIGIGVVTDVARPPNGRAEVPWPGGLARWSNVIPMRVSVEIKKPVFLKFVSAYQNETGFSKSQFQRGFSPIGDAPGQLVAERIVERSLEELAEQEVEARTAQPDPPPVG